MSLYSTHMTAHNNIRNQIHNCHRCPLGKSATRVPFGGVSWAPKILLLGEAPGAAEDKAGTPFVGRAGYLLDDMLARVGLRRDHTMIINTICCRPPANRDPEYSEIEACKPNLDAQINLGRTWVGVAMGRIALGALQDDYKVPIGAWKGRPFWRGDKVWVPTYHPAYGLRNKPAVEEIVMHLKQAVDLHAGLTEPPKPKTDGYRVEGEALVVDHEKVEVPPGVEELTRARFTKAEWAKMAYASAEMRQGTIEMKSQLGASVDH